MPAAQTHWFLYVLKCHDGSFYCGITTDVLRRLEQHNAGTGARYTRARRPVVVEQIWPCKDRSTALKSESAFKKLSRAKKIRQMAESCLPCSRAPKPTRTRSKGPPKP